MPFLFGRDPLFLACVAVYFLNRFVLKQIWSSGFVHEHLNDVLCIPFWVPIMIALQKRCGLRDTDGPPTTMEIIIPLVIWSWLFEIVLPATRIMGDLCVADYRDILAYAFGALVAGVIWRWWYGPRERAQTPQRIDIEPNSPSMNG